MLRRVRASFTKGQQRGRQGSPPHPPALGGSGRDRLLPSGRDGGEGHSSSGWPACTSLPVQGVRNHCSAGRTKNNKTLLFGSLSGNSKQRFGIFPRCLVPRLYPGSPGAHPEGPSVGTGNSSRGSRPRPRLCPHLCAPGSQDTSARSPPPGSGPGPALTPAPQAPRLRPRPDLRPHPRA